MNSIVFSPREAEAIELLKLGCSNAAASQKMGVKLKTFKFHLLNACRKAGVKSRLELLTKVQGSDIIVGTRSEHLMEEIDLLRNRVLELEVTVKNLIAVSETNKNSILPFGTKRLA